MSLSQEKKIVSIARFLMLSIVVGLIAQSILFAVAAYEVDSIWLKVFLVFSSAVSIIEAGRRIYRRIMIKKLLKRLEFYDDGESDVLGFGQGGNNE